MTLEAIQRASLWPTLEGDEAVFRAILDAVPVAICLVHAPSWHVGFINGRMKRLLGDAISTGMTYVELTTLFDEITPGGAPPKFEDRLLYRTLVEGGVFVGVEVFVQIDGQRVPMLMSITPIADKRTAMTVAAVVTLEDLRPLREADRAKEEFLALVSHELRSPLTLILGHSTSLLMKDVRWSAQQQQAFIEAIRSQAQRLTMMVGELLDLTTITAGRFRIEPEWTDITQLIRATVRAHSPHLKEHPVQLYLGRRLPKVYVDPQRIDQVLRNLLDNVVRHTPAGTKIRITAREQDSNLVVIVEDSGPGVPADVRDGVFERFRRGERSVGAGLGLAIARTIMAEHGGSIELKPRKGGGTLVELSVPVVSEAELPTHP